MMKVEPWSARGSHDLEGRYVVAASSDLIRFSCIKGSTKARPSTILKLRAVKWLPKLRSVAVTGTK